VNHRDRVLNALQHKEPDVVPIYSLGFEQSCSTYQQFLRSTEYKANAKTLPGAGDITEQRFWKADLWAMHPWKEFTTEYYPAPEKYSDCSLHFTGRVYRQEMTGSRSGVPFRWYQTGLFTSPDIVHEYWDQYGKPVDLIDDSQDYSPHVWEKFVNELSPYFYPMAWLTLSIHEGLFEGMTLSKLAYYMKKQPGFVHEIADAFLNANLELIKRFGEAGVEVVFYSDDFAQHGRSILSRKDFETFILPRYKQLYDACKKQNMIVVQHSCGFVDEFLPLVIDAGLDAIQSLEPAACVDLAGLKEKYGDKIAFLGGMDSTRVLCFGTPEEVVNEVRRCFAAAGNGGGYFAGPAHTILDAPWENIIAFRDAIEKYRKYPIASLTLESR
jgi:uroporphyrinogen-III decarboxylase